MNGSQPEPPHNLDGAPPAVAPDQIINALLGSIGNTGQIDPVSLLMAQFGGISPDDPRSALLQQLLEQRRSSVPDQADQEPEEDPAAAQITARRAAQARQERVRRMRELRETMQRMFAELEKLRSHNDTLAAALGACYLCFGSDPLCEECRGDGVPGSLVPDPDAYREFVLPAVQRLRTAMDRRLPSNPYQRPTVGGVSGQPIERTRTTPSAASIEEGELTS